MFQIVSCEDKFLNNCTHDYITLLNGFTNTGVIKRTLHPHVLSPSYKCVT